MRTTSQMRASSTPGISTHPPWRQIIMKMWINFKIFLPVFHSSRSSSIQNTRLAQRWGGEWEFCICICILKMGKPDFFAKFNKKQAILYQESHVPVFYFFLYFVICSRTSSLCLTHSWSLPRISPLAVVLSGNFPLSIYIITSSSLNYTVTYLHHHSLTSSLSTNIIIKICVTLVALFLSMSCWLYK